MRAKLLLSCLALAVAGSYGELANAQASVETAAVEPADAAIPPMPLNQALSLFAERTGLQLVYVSSVAEGMNSGGAPANLEPAATLPALLSGTGLGYRFINDKTVTIAKPEALQGSALPADGEAAAVQLAQSGENVTDAAVGDDLLGGEASATATVETSRRGGIEEVIVTAQKKEERIQDIPIAISAFSSEDLDAQKLEGGFDLLKAIPNVTFSKSNFTGYNFSIRGVGTKAISATTDPGVSVAFNYSGLIQNRLFEQEYFDVERIEVLRGPQGTLYGRNATGGVVNVISEKPRFNEFGGSVKSEVGNYGSRRGVGVINVPLIDDVMAFRLAGSFTQRDGYGYNDKTQNQIDGRDLWSGRATLSFAPIDQIRADFVWEHFSEDDNRARTSKQLCHKDEGPTQVRGVPTFGKLQQAFFSQGCKPGSLYDKAAYDTPNGLAMAPIFAIPALGSESGRGLFSMARMPSGDRTHIYDAVDPYEGVSQNRDLRTISSLRDPVYKAEADIVQINLKIDMSESLTLHSQTVYNKDHTYSTQDYNRFNSKPIFKDTSNWKENDYSRPIEEVGPSKYTSLAPGGVFCDPQLGCSNTIVMQDIAQASSEQWAQEFRLHSNSSGPLNFSIGANYTRFDFEADYYVLSNVLTLLAVGQPFNAQPDYTKCGTSGGLLELDDPSISKYERCIYVDPNPLERVNGEGHNYFRSRNPYVLESYAVFGEMYWQMADKVRLTAGIRVTDDRKKFQKVPSQVLLSARPITGGTVSRGYPTDGFVNQSWQEPTGRVVLDWKPRLSFADETLIYGSIARGYKGGGANPPSIGYNKQTVAEMEGLPSGLGWIFDRPALYLTAQNYPATFKPEYVNAVEVGTKNTLLGGGVILNATAFYYDYKDYQVSKIVDRTAVNENFDAEVWGLEIETFFAPIPDLLINANLGLLDTRIGEGAQSIDIMNRTQGDPDWMVAKPWFQLPSNCVVPTEIVRGWLEYNLETDPYDGYTGIFCGGGFYPENGGSRFGIPQDYRAENNPNGGAGFAQNLNGNELPNSPHWTVNIGAQYTWHIFNDWDISLRGDYYRQGDSYARVYNAVNDKLRGWGNANARLTVARPQDDLQIEFYVKNLLDDDPITDAFINSDDTGLTTNVFVLDPRLIGLSIRKGF